MNSYKILDSVLLILAIIFFIGLILYEYETFGLSEPIFEISPEWKIFFEYVIFPLIALLVFDLVLKYKKTKNTKKFVKTYWIDIVMLILIPIFSAFKFFKIGISIVKKLKTVKMSAKIIQKSKKVAK